MAKNTKPAIRFKGFTDAWEQRKLGEEVEFYNGLTYTPADIVESGGTLVLRSSNVQNGEIVTDDNVYVNSDVVNSDNVQVGDIAVVVRNGSKALIGKHAKIKENMPFTVIGAFMTGIRSEQSAFINALLSTSLFDKEVEKNMGATINQITGGMFKSMEFRFPQKAEKELIGEYFDHLDHLITLHQRKYDSLVNVKKAMLEKMFPKNGETVPEIRFKGFTDAWEQRKLGEVGKARFGVGFPDAEQGGSVGVPFFKVSDMNLDGNENEMIIANNYVTVAQILAHRWSPIEELPAIFFAKVGAAVMLNRKRLCRFPFLLDNNTMAYSIPSINWNADFAKALFETVDLTSLVQIGALPSYNASDVEDITICLPNLSEQMKVGAYFKQIDNLITLHQRKLEKLKNIKKSCLEKMFV